MRRRLLHVVEELGILHVALLAEHLLQHEHFVFGLREVRRHERLAVVLLLTRPQSDVV